MVASVGFKKQLWALEPELDVVWNFVGKRWEIWRFPGQKKEIKKKWNDRAHHVMTIKGEDGSYRDVGADVLLNLQKGDTHRYSLKQLVDYFDQMDKNIQREKEKKLMNLISAMNRDMLEYTGSRKIAVPKEYMIEVPKETRVKSLLGGG